MSASDIAAGVIVGAGIVALLFVISLLSAVPVWLLWNWLIPDIFGLRAIGFWEAFGLSLLCGILFKSSGTSSSKSK